LSLYFAIEKQGWKNMSLKSKSYCSTRYDARTVCREIQFTENLLRNPIDLKQVSHASEIIAILKIAPNQGICYK